MEITPGRAPFAEDEDYKPLRKPKSASTTPTHEHVYNAMNSALGGAIGNTVASGDFVNSQQQQQLQQQQQQMLPNYGRTVSPSNLSPFAKEFVPRFGGSNSATSVQERLLQQQKQQQQYVQQNYQQYHQPQPQPHAHTQNRATNGYTYNNQQHYHHQQQQQQAQQQQQQQQGNYPTQMTSLCSSVQDRLRISGNNGPSGSQQNASNSYNHHQQQQQHHQHQPQQHYQNPHGRHNKHNQHQQQQRYQHHGTNSRSHANNSSNANNSVANGGDNNKSNDVETVALNYLHTVLHCLNENPGQFDTEASRFLTLFDGMENNQYVLSNAMEDIFQESITNPNFRYMGAKLYNLLHMLNLKKDSLFHTLLKCKLDYHQTEVLQYMQSNQQDKVRETALFLAELYMQLRGDDSRIHLIAENIVFSLKQLLSRESNENIRCICLTLKLAGYDLTTDCAKDIHEIIAQLDAINVKSPGKYPLAANVISLQKNNWGRKVCTTLPDVEMPKPPEPLRISDEPVFYGPDGRELTSEEAEFLTGGAATQGNLSDEDDAAEGDVDFDPEMDEETEKAYKEFCKLNQSASAT